LYELVANSKRIEVEAADLFIQKRQLIAPIDGEVTQVARSEGEWVSAGDPVLQIVNLEKLYVKGWVNYLEYPVSQVEGKNVTLEVARNGGVVVAPGKIVYADKTIYADKGYEVTAEIANKLIDGHWELQPGMEGTMTIHVR
jgi:multidrug efflux pump subunit AcrA (membrane-fusion protein)